MQVIEVTESLELKKIYEAAFDEGEGDNIVRDYLGGKQITAKVDLGKYDYAFDDPVLGLRVAESSNSVFIANLRSSEEERLTRFKFGGEVIAIGSYPVS